MALNTANVGVAVTGEVSSGPTTAAAPASAAAALTGYIGHGYISEDGIEENPEVSRESLRAWQNGKVVREVTTEARMLYTFTLLETTKDNVELYYGTTVTQSATEGTYTINPAATKGVRSFVIDVLDGAAIERKYVARGEIFKGEGRTYAGGEITAYPCELVAYTDPVVFDTRLKTGA